jgi:hypothetical protein
MFNPYLNLGMFYALIMHFISGLQLGDCELSA